MGEGARVVCGTDLSGNARPALEAAAALAALAGGELWIVHAAEPGPAGGPSGAAMQQHEERLAAWRRDVQLPIPASRIHEAVLVGPAAASLSAFAEARGAMALVVSSRGHSAGPLFKLGGTSEQVAVESRVPVLVIRDAAPFTRWARGDAPLRALLAIDFTPSSDPPIGFARLLRAAGPTEVTVAHVYYPGASSRYGLEPLEVTAERDGSLDALLSRDLARRVGDLGGVGKVVFRPCLGTGRIGDHVLDAVRSERADLVVVGTRGKRGYRRFASVSSVVLHHGHVAVACAPRLAPPEAADPLATIRRVLVATDLREPCSAAVAQAYRLVLDGGGEVVLLHVAPAAPGGGAAQRDAELTARLRALVPAWSAARGIVSWTEIVRGDDVARAIREAAARLRVDAVCVATRGRAHGSIAEQVARECDRPVLVVPSGP